MLDVDVGVLHGALAADQVDAEQLGQAKVVAGGAGLVVPGGLPGGHQAAPARHKVLQLLALPVRQAGDIGQHQGVEAGQAVGVEQLVVDHLKGYACLDEGLVPAVDGALDLFAGLLSAVPGAGVLRVDQPHAGQVLDVAEVLFVAPVPVVDVGHRLYQRADRGGRRRTWYTRGAPPLRTGRRTSAAHASRAASCGCRGRARWCRSALRQAGRGRGGDAGQVAGEVQRRPARPSAALWWGRRPASPPWPRATRVPSGTGR